MNYSSGPGKKLHQCLEKNARIHHPPWDNPSPFIAMILLWFNEGLRVPSLTKAKPPTYQSTKQYTNMARLPRDMIQNFCCQSPNPPTCNFIFNSYDFQFLKKLIINLVGEAQKRSGTCLSENDQAKSSGYSSSSSGEISPCYYFQTWLYIKSEKSSLTF